MENDKEVESVQFKINGKLFYCECRCNCFHYIHDEKLGKLAVCNSCGAEYLCEPV